MLELDELQSLDYERKLLMDNIVNVLSGYFVECGVDGVSVSVKNGGVLVRVSGELSSNILNTFQDLFQLGLVRVVEQRVENIFSSSDVEGEFREWKYFFRSGGGIL